MANALTVSAIFRAIDRVTAPVNRMAANMQRATRRMTASFRHLNSGISNFTNTLRTAALAGVAALGSLGFAMTNVIGIGADFGRQIGAAASKFPEGIERGTKAFEALKTAAKDVGKTTEFTAVQAATGLNFLAKAGFKAGFAMKALRPLVDFTTASEMEFAEAASIVADSLGAFGLNVADPVQKLTNLHRTMDVMSKAANSANFSVAEMFESVKDGAPISQAAGASIETFSATMAVLAKNGIKASKAGTAAKNITLALAGVGNQAAGIFKRLAIKLDVGGEMRDQLDVMDELRTKLSAFGGMKQLQIIEGIFGKIPIASAIILLKDTTSQVRKLRETFIATAGSTQRIAAFIRNDLRGSLDSLGSAIEGVKLAIVDMNEGGLKETIKRMTMWIRKNEELIATNIGGFLRDIIDNLDNIITTARQITGVIVLYIAFASAVRVATLAVIAFNAVVIVMAAVVTVVKTAVAAFAVVVGLLPKVIALAVLAQTALNLIWFGSPIGLIVAGVTAFIAIAGLLIVAWGPVTEFFSDLADTISGLAIDLSNFVGGFGNLATKFKSVFGFGDSEVNINGESPAPVVPQVVSPAERVASSIQETSTTNTSEVLIKTTDGVNAEVTQGKLGAGLILQPSGGM